MADENTFDPGTLAEIAQAANAIKGNSPQGSAKDLSPADDPTIIVDAQAVQTGGRCDSPRGSEAAAI